MANGKLVKMLIMTDVVKYLEFKAVDGSFVQDKYKKIQKVPSNDVEALKSSLMGLFEKRRARSFFIFVQARPSFQNPPPAAARSRSQQASLIRRPRRSQDYDENDQRTWQGLDLRNVPMKAVYEKFGLDEGTTDFIGHALALQQDDSYMSRAAYDTVMAIKLYAESMARFNGGSPYIYPLYGLGELPQAFARLSAVYGGTYMLNKPDVEARRRQHTLPRAGPQCACAEGGGVRHGACGGAGGVRRGGRGGGRAQRGADGARGAGGGRPVLLPGQGAQGEGGGARHVPDEPPHPQHLGRALRANHHPLQADRRATPAATQPPLASSVATGGGAGGSAGRNTDVYVFCCSYAHNVVAKNKWVAFVSTVQESARPEQDLEAGLALLGPVEHQFVWTTDLLEARRRRRALRGALGCSPLPPLRSDPAVDRRARCMRGGRRVSGLVSGGGAQPTTDGTREKAFVSRGYDETSHFEGVTNDVLDLYRRITGKELDLDKQRATA